MLYLRKQATHKGGFLMKNITQDIEYYQAILSYADRHGVTINGSLLMSPFLSFSPV